MVRAFHVFCVRQEKDRTIVDDDFEEAEEDGDLECSGCEREKDSCACADLLVQGLELPIVAGYCATCTYMLCVDFDPTIISRNERHRADISSINIFSGFIRLIEQMPPLVSFNKIWTYFMYVTVW